MSVTVHQFTAGHDGGGGAPNDRIDVNAIGGVAFAGDLLMVTTTGVAGDWDNVPVIEDDVSGTSGWVKAFDDTLLGGENLRVIGFKKVAVGGETQITTTWPGPVNHVSVGAWIEDPGLPDLVYLSSGNDGSVLFHLIFTNPAPIPDDGAVYIGGVAWGNSGVSNANFNSPTAHGGVGTITSGDGAGGIQHYNADEGSNNTGQTLQYEFQPDSAPRVIMYWWATAEAAPPGEVDLAGVGTLGLGGVGDLTVTGGDSAELEGTGTLGLGAEGLLTLTGGDQPLAGVGTLGLGRSGLLTAARPFPPVPVTPAMTGQLDCGIYDVFIFTRGLTEIVGRIPFNQLNWTRVLDDTSAAEVTVNGVSNVGTMRDCCQLLGSINPWEHELALYRNGLRVWSGPVTKVSYPSETVIIDAADLSAWLGIRALNVNHNDVQQDLATIWVEYVDDAMSVDNSPGLFPIVQALTGVLADRLYTVDMHTVAADAIAELARTGLDWCCVDRRMTGGPVPPQPPAYPDAQPIPTLIDASFLVAPTVERDGKLMANVIYSNAMGSGPGGNAIFGEYGPEFPDTPDHVAQPAAPDYAAIEAQFGRIEQVFQETKILDQPSADQNAATRYDLLKLPVDVISSGTLLPTAGIDIRQLLPGSVQNVHLSRACVQIGAPYRLKQLTVQANNDGSESVEGVWEPLGSLAAHEDLGGSGGGGG